MSVTAAIYSYFDAKGVKQAEDAFGKLEKKLKTAIGVAALAQFGKAAIAAAEDGQRSAARIGQIAEQMGLFGAETKKVTSRLLEYADSLAKTTGIDDDVIKGTQAKLLTFAQLAKTADTVGGAFDRATRAAMDLSAAGLGEAESLAVSLGKALQDPVKGITALTKAGVTFTQAQKDQIRVLVESGRQYEAQNVILKAIEQQVGGTAEATATASGKLSVAWDQLLETVGTALMPAFEALVNALIPIIDAFAALPEEMQTAILVAVALGAAYLKLRTVIQSLKVAASTANAAFAIFAVATEAYFLLVGNGAADAEEKVAGFISEVDRMNDTQALDNFVNAWNDVRNNLDLGITDLEFYDLTGDRQDELAREKLRDFVADFARGNTEAAKRVLELLVAEGKHESMIRYLTSAIYDEEAAQGILAENTGATTEADMEAADAAAELAQKRKEATDAAWKELDARLALGNAALAAKAADRGVADALTEYRDLLWEVNTGKYEGSNADRDLAESADAFYNAALRAAAAADEQAKSVAEAAGATYSADDAARVQIKSLQETAAQLAPDSPLRKQLLEYIGLLEGRIPQEIITNFYAKVKVTYDTSTLARFAGLIQYRAAGGPVDASTPYIVGENGPELFVPGSAGQIISNSDLSSGAGRTAPGGVNIVVNGALDSAGVARQIRKLLVDNQVRYDLPVAV